MISLEGVKYAADECPIDGLHKVSEGEASSGDVLPTPKAKVASSWRTNLKHRLKYGAAADFAATDEDMETVEIYITVFGLIFYIYMGLFDTWFDLMLCIGDCFCWCLIT
jgi:hypothetical protein